MTLADETAFMDATQQAELIRNGEVSAGELLEAAIERAERINPKINAIISPLYDRARSSAENIGDGPLAGVPFLLKDVSAELAGTSMHEGSGFLDGYVSPVNCELTNRFLDAGLVVMGKTNTPEFALLPTTEPERFGPSRNPWNTDLGTGGSSGGSSAAVAAGIVPAAHANDGGGSIRIPASCCGLVGLKPTRGRNTLAPHFGDIGGGLVHEHVVTRSVRDSAVILQATAGPAAGDPYWPAAPERPYAEEVDRDPGRLRIAYSSVPLTGVPVSPDVRQALEATANLCADLGHEVEEAEPEIDRPRTLKSFGKAWVGLLGWTMDYWSRKTGKEPTEADFEPLTWQMYQSSQALTAGAYLSAIEGLQAMSRNVAAFFEEIDVWLTPTLCREPAPLGYFGYTPETRDQHITRLGEYSGFTSMFNGTGQPAVTLPLQWTQDGLPLGMQFAARYGDEATLFRLAAQLEKAKPWADRRPPVAA